MMTTCWVCNSNQFINDVVVRDDVNVSAHGTHRAPIRLETYGDPSAVFFKEAKSCQLRAQVCASCGHVEFFAADPRALL